MRRQQVEIDALNHALEGRFRVLKGVEANILADGTLDLRGEELAGVEMLLAAPHSKLRLPDDQTDRMLVAVRTPGVHVLAHPRGRMSDSRPGINADWDRVFEEAATPTIPVAFIYTETAIAHARLAGIPASRVINCWETATAARVAGRSPLMI